MPSALGSFKEKQGGQCGWNPVSEGMEERIKKVSKVMGEEAVIGHSKDWFGVPIAAYKPSHNLVA